MLRDITPKSFRSKNRSRPMLILWSLSFFFFPNGMNGDSKLKRCMYFKGMSGVKMLKQCIVSCMSLRIYSKIGKMEDRMTHGIITAIKCYLKLFKEISFVTRFLPSEKVKQSFWDQVRVVSLLQIWNNEIIEQFVLLILPSE